MLSGSAAAELLLGCGLSKAVVGRGVVVELQTPGLLSSERFVHKTGVFSGQSENT